MKSMKRNKQRESLTKKRWKLTACHQVSPPAFSLIEMVVQRRRHFVIKDERTPSFTVNEQLPDVADALLTEEDLALPREAEINELL